MVGWLEQANTLVMLLSADLKVFSVTGFVPRTTFLLEDSLPVVGSKWK